MSYRTVWPNWIDIAYTSGYQPGVRVPLGAREKSQGVRLIFINLRFTLTFRSSTSLQGVREFPNFCLGVREQKKVGNRWPTKIWVAVALTNILNKDHKLQLKRNPLTIQLSSVDIFKPLWIHNNDFCYMRLCFAHFCEK